VTDSSDEPSSVINSNVPHTARIWNYWLGGKDNFGADRTVGDQVQQFLPDIVTSARADRAFLQRAVRLLVAEAGIRQFLDIGTGLPTAQNTHEVAQSIAPDSRIVYADNDPMVLAHARALLTSTPEGATDYLDADARDTDTILRAAANTLDFGRPVAVMLLGVLNFVGDDEEARGVVRRLMAGVPAGSYLAIAHPTTEIKPEESAAAAKQWNETATPPITLRSKADLLRYFEGLDLLEPGVVTCTKWRPEPDDPTADTDVYQFGGLARKP
jgi:O-methyltransferase involved in polyketide biosynthesis